MSEQVFTNAKIVLADEVVDGSIAVEGGVITQISERPSSLSGAIDLEGDYLIPGLVELHTDNLERHIMPRPKSFWPLDAALLNHDREVASAGITTVFDAMFVGDDDGEVREGVQVSELADVMRKLRSERALKADHMIHWRCEVSSDNVFGKIENLIGQEETGLVSVMDHTPGQRQFASIEQYAIYYKGKFGLNDEEFEQFMVKRIEKRDRNSEKNRRLIVELANDRKVPLASHDDATVGHVDEAIDDGIVVAEFPTTLEAAKASHENDLKVLMGAPNVVRGKSHSGNISARELASHGYLDILSSDYVPYSLLYGAILLERECEGISLPQAIATVTKNPAGQVGMTDRGEIAVGKKADLVRFRNDGNVPTTIEVWKHGMRIS